MSALVREKLKIIQYAFYFSGLKVRSRFEITAVVWLHQFACIDPVVTS